MVRRSEHDARSVTRALLALCALAACSGGDGTSPRLARMAQSLAGAELDTEHTGVVLIADTSFLAGYCSGTLIAPNLVLTAHHCVAQAPAGDIDCATDRFGRPHPPRDLWVSADSSVDAYDFRLIAGIESGAAGFVPVAEVHVPEREALLCGNDIALLVLERPLPKGVQPITPRLDEGVRRSDTYIAVGFGEVAQGEGLGTRRIRGDISVVCGTGECPDAVSFSNATEVLGGDAVCSGDSGGPALDRSGRVFAVASRSAANCGSTVYTAVEPWAEWIRGVASLAWRRGGYAEPEWLSQASLLPNPELVEVSPVPGDATPEDEPEIALPSIEPEPEGARSATAAGGCSASTAPRSGWGVCAALAAAALAFTRRAAPRRRAARVPALRPRPTPRATARPPRS